MQKPCCTAQSENVRESSGSSVSHDVVVVQRLYRPTMAQRTADVDDFRALTVNDGAVAQASASGENAS
jgi:hypothetical protein